MTAEGTFPKVDGDILYSSEVNNIRNSIQQVYTGSAMDLSYGYAGATSQTGSIILDFINPGSLTGANYVSIRMTGISTITTPNSDGGGTSISLKAQSKHSGGTFSDISAASNIISATEIGNDAVTKTNARTYELIHTLTANDLTSGLYIMPVVVGTISTLSGAFNYTNKNVVVQTL